MSKSIKHAYEVIEHTAGGNVEVGGFLIDKGHVRSQHEPTRLYQYMNTNTAEYTYTLAEHIGEWEKVKKYVSGYKDSRIMRPVVEFYRDCGEEGYDGGDKAREILPDDAPPYESSTEEERNQ